MIIVNIYIVKIFNMVYDGIKVQLTKSRTKKQNLQK